MMQVGQLIGITSHHTMSLLLHRQRPSLHAWLDGRKVISCLVVEPHECVCVCACCGDPFTAGLNVPMEAGPEEAEAAHMPQG